MKSSKYPLLFWQPLLTDECSGRLRIIYPNGTAEWSFTDEISKDNMLPCWSTFPPCWWRKGATQKGAIKLMQNYDVRNRYPSAIFLGEIK